MRPIPAPGPGLRGSPQTLKINQKSQAVIGRPIGEDPRSYRIARIAERIIAGADGATPLFITELAKAVIESGSATPFDDNIRSLPLSGLQPNDGVRKWSKVTLSRLDGSVLRLRKITIEPHSAAR